MGSSHFSMSEYVPKNNLWLHEETRRESANFLLTHVVSDTPGKPELQIFSR